MSEASVAITAQKLLRGYAERIEALEAQLEAARSLTTTLEAEAHACPNEGHHRGWWTTPTEEL